MHSLVIALILFSTAIAVLTVAIRRLGGWGGPVRMQWWKALLAVCLTVLGAVLIWAIGHPLLAGDDDLVGGPFIFFLAMWLEALGFFVRWKKPRVSQSIGRWCIYGMVIAALYGTFELVVEEFVLQTCRPMQTSKMTPTILGFHTTQSCPSCDGELCVTLFRKVGRDGAEIADERYRKEGVCESCLTVQNVSSHVGPFRRPDHYIVNHSLSPERWRIVAFRVPRTSGGFPEIGRLVGLPGETVFLREGAVWINGIRLETPSGLRPFRYTEHIPPRVLEIVDKQRVKCFGHPDEPLTLNANSYFILNDEPTISMDSRVYGPYQGENYLGVVDCIYWPPRRWQLLR